MGSAVVTTRLTELYPWLLCDSCVGSTEHVDQGHVIGTTRRQMRCRQCGRVREEEAVTTPMPEPVAPPEPNLAVATVLELEAARAEVTTGGNGHAVDATADTLPPDNGKTADVVLPSGWRTLGDRCEGKPVYTCRRDDEIWRAGNVYWVSDGGWCDGYGHAFGDDLGAAMHRATLACPSAERADACEGDWLERSLAAFKTEMRDWPQWKRDAAARDFGLVYQEIERRAQETPASIACARCGVFGCDGDEDCDSRRGSDTRTFAPDGSVVEPSCPICKRLWSAAPGTVFCGSQHGLCPMCSNPRTLGSCRCLTSSTEAAPEPVAPVCKHCGKTWRAHFSDLAFCHDNESPPTYEVAAPTTEPVAPTTRPAGCLGKRERVWHVNPGFISAEQCPACGHSRCGVDCDCRGVISCPHWEQPGDPDRCDVCKASAAAQAELAVLRERVKELEDERDEWERRARERLRKYGQILNKLDDERQARDALQAKVDALCEAVDEYRGGLPSHFAFGNWVTQLFAARDALKPGGET
jgi:hypothetical protein